MTEQPRSEQQNEFNYEMEKRMTVIENWKDCMQAEMVHRLMEQVCNRINLNPGAHLPKIGQLFIDFNRLSNDFDKKCTADSDLQKEKEESGTHSFEILKNLQF